MSRLHLYIHVHDAPAPFEPARHPRGHGGHFLPGGGGKSGGGAAEAAMSARKKLPISTGVPPHKDSKRQKRRGKRRKP